MNSHDFHLKNKDCQWLMPAAPEGISSDYEIADWLLNKSNFGWLELDITFDVNLWKNEAACSAPYLVPHRESDSHGWNSACIHGIDVGCTGAWTRYGYSTESEVPYKWTELSKLTPNIKQFWEEFPYEHYRRIRFMELVPQGYINPHSDAPGRLPGEIDLDMLEFGVPVNVAISHPEHCSMTLDGYGEVPFSFFR